MLTRESFLAFSFPEPREIEVPALGGSVMVWCLTAGERDQFEVEQIESKGTDFRARVTVYTCRDSATWPLFSKVDIPWLTQLPPYVLDPIVQAAIELNKFGAGDIEDFEKNSESGPSDASS